MKKQILHVQILFLLAGLLAGCTSSLSTPTPTNTLVPTSANQSASSATVTPTEEALPILPHRTVDPSTMTGKLMMGYQGWFACPDN